MRQRRAFISFPTEHGSSASLLNKQKLLSGVNISFNINITSQFGIPSEASIDVYNLNREDLQFLTTSAATWLVKQSLIQLYAGYDDDVELLFGGRIVEAKPMGYPDLQLHIRGLSGFEWMTRTISIEKENLKVLDLLDYVSSVTKYPINIPKWLRDTNEFLNKKLESFSYTGSVWNLLDEIQKMCGGFSIDEKSIVLSTYNDSINVYNAGQTNTGKTLLINDTTGMIGVPTPTSVGIDVKILLNPTIKTGDIIYLESKRIPMCNGIYRVVQITHTGELRGKNWYSSLHCTYVGKPWKDSQEYIDMKNKEKTND